MMHSLVNELAKKLNLTPEEAEEALSDVLIRVRAGLETIGEVEVEGLGTFKSIDDDVAFEPSDEFLEEVNREFAGMKPVALTATGESVDPDDRRALPGAKASEEDDVEPADETSSESDFEVQRESASSEPVLSDPVASEDPDVEDDGLSKFTSPPPPFPSKIRVPPGERRSSRRPRTQATTTEEIPDMGSVVTTRPAEPIRTATQTRRRSMRVPAIVVVIVAVGLMSWIVFGGGESEPESSESKTELVSPEPVEEDPPVESVVNSQADMESVDEPAVETATGVEPVGDDTTSEGTVDAATDQPEMAEADAEPERTEPVQEPDADAATMITGPTYAWIIASYPSRNEAQNRVDGMRASGYDAGVYEATVRGNPAFRVGIGRFESEAAARQGRDMVPPEISDAWVTRVK